MHGFPVPGAEVVQNRHRLHKTVHVRPGNLFERLFKRRTGVLRRSRVRGVLGVSIGSVLGSFGNKSKFWGVLGSKGKFWKRFGEFWE